MPALPASMPGRVSPQRARKDPHAGGHPRQSHGRTRQQELVGPGLIDPHVLVVVRLDHDTLNLETGEQTLAARVRNDSGSQQGIGRSRGSAPDWTSDRAALAADFELVFKQTSKRIIIHE